MADQNPNPRGFRLKSFFADLEQVQAVTRDGQNNITHVHLVGRETSVTVSLVPESHDEFLKALEVYKSWR